MKLDKLDILFSRYIKLKAEGKCEYCGQYPRSKQGYHTHHYVGRRYLNTRWEEDNAVALDLTCHNLFEDFSTIEQEFFIQRIGTKRMEELEVVARTYRKMDKTRKDAITKELKEKIEILKGVGVDY